MGEYHRTGSKRLCHHLEFALLTLTLTLSGCIADFGYRSFKIERNDTDSDIDGDKPETPTDIHIETDFFSSDRADDSESDDSEPVKDDTETDGEPETAPETEETDSTADTSTHIVCEDNVGESLCWYDKSWGYRRKITILSSRVQGDSQRNFPVLLSATHPDWKSRDNFGHVGQSDGGDFVFTSNDATRKLAHDIERYTPSTGELIAWVSVPEVSASTDTIIYVYYGHSEAEDQSDAFEVWNDGGDDLYGGVWHMGETGRAERLDSTQNANTCTHQNYNGDEVTPGKIGSADLLDGTTDWLGCGNDPSLNIQKQITLSAWVKPSLPRIREGNWANGFFKGSYGFYLYGTDNNTTTLGLYVFVNGQETDIWDRGSIDIPPGQWSYLAITYDGNNLKAHINGKLDYAVSVPGSFDDSSDQNLTVSVKANKNNGSLKGAVDEMRISKVARSANWIATCFNNQRDPGSFYTVGNEVPK